MKKYIIIVIGLSLTLSLYGCGIKERKVIESCKRILLYIHTHKDIGEYYPDWFLGNCMSPTYGYSQKDICSSIAIVDLQISLEYKLYCQ